MESWERHMPDRMLLRSRWHASHIANPNRNLTLDRFREATGFERRDPTPIGRFIEYGRWFQQHGVPELEQRRVERLTHDGRTFQLELADGERLEANRVVVAAGIVPFAWRPPEFSELPPELVSHTADHSSLDPFAGRRVLVVGGGQSALESAALLAEAGADVRLVARRPRIVWLAEDYGDDVPRTMYAYARIGIGGTRSSWVAARPELFRHLPMPLREPLARRCAPPPAGASWLQPRLANVDLTAGRSVRSLAARNEHLEVRFDDGKTDDVDHVLLATGYKIDVGRYRFLDESLLRKIRAVEGRPVLGAGLESSVPGLHFVGASASPTFGPVMRFVAGTWAAARAVTREIVGPPAPRTGFSW